MAKRQYAHIRGELLTWARRSLRMGLEEAAERLRVPPERLAAWESGEQKPTVNQLRKAARVYRRPLAAFFLPEPPRDFAVPHVQPTARRNADAEGSLEPAGAARVAREVRDADLDKMTPMQALDLLRKLKGEL